MLKFMITDLRDLYSNHRKYILTYMIPTQSLYVVLPISYLASLTALNDDIRRITHGALRRPVAAMRENAVTCTTTPFNVYRRRRGLRRLIAPCVIRLSITAYPVHYGMNIYQVNSSLHNSKKKYCDTV